ncbi:substrate-binding periplasmic protein [Thioalkalivibrio sulfidiphilus]|uniref:substrate-binding periplasmic protein n=1 Tax=Thioalkalivibrio sulfidiphilus TaxID=1033854 RepID=UPI000361A903|nr:transporter substrate-binding domain-containing protein [Thioalkalivibrio sulfidiphilus]
MPTRKRIVTRLINTWVAFCLLFSSGLAGAQSQTPHRSLDELVWITEEYAPYNYAQDGQVTGVAVDILVKIWERLGVNRTVADIQLLPWARGYRMALDQPGTCLFSTTVTDARRELFTFVEPIMDASISIIAPRDRGLEVADVAALAPYRIGVVREDIGDQLLQEEGFSGTYVRTDSARILIRMLRGERFDAAAYNERVANWVMVQEGIDPALYEPALVLREGYMGYACHKDTDPALIAQLQDALDALIADGTVAEITNRYLQ